MTVLNKWAISPGNKGRAHWATRTGGIPVKKPKWQLLKCSKYGAGWEFCATDSSVYINSADLLAVAIDIVTGEQRWEVTFPDEATSSIAINGNEICIPPYILSQENGELLTDLSAFGYQFRVVEDVGENVIVLSTIGEKKGIYLYREHNCEFIDVQMRGVSLVNNEKNIVGFDDSYFFCYSIGEHRKIWLHDILVGTSEKSQKVLKRYLVVNNKIYQNMYHDSIRCLNVNDGNILWSHEQSFPGEFLGCEDTLHICQEISDHGSLQARSTCDGRELWKVNAPQARAFLIAGDLLFGALSDVPVAWDRYTGEVVWRAEKGMTAIFHAVAASNKIVYTNTMSQMRCYEWTEPYHSPAKG